MQMNLLENIQKDAVTISNGLPASTPYQGLKYECGLKPMKYRIKEKSPPPLCSKILKFCAPLSSPTTTSLVADA